MTIFTLLFLHCCLCHSPSPYLSIPVAFSNCAFVETRAAAANYVQGYRRGVIQTLGVSHRYGQGVACMCVAESPVRGVLCKPVAHAESLADSASLTLYYFCAHRRRNWTSSPLLINLPSLRMQNSTNWNSHLSYQVPPSKPKASGIFRMKRAFPRFLLLPL